MIKKLLIAYCIYSSSVIYAGEEQALRSIESHFLIDNPQQALVLSKEYMGKYPDSLKLRASYVRALSENGDSREAIKYWKSVESLDQDIKQSLLLEDIAWGIIKSAVHSSQGFIHRAMLVSACQTHDVRAVKMLCRYLNASDALTRALAAQLSASYPHPEVIQKLQNLLQSEKQWYVRLEVIQSLGRMKHPSIALYFRRLIDDPRASLEEKYMAIEALINCYDSIPINECMDLLQSNRAGLRHLACEAYRSMAMQAIDKDDKENIRSHRMASQITKLLNDSCADVRVSAILALSVNGAGTLTKPIQSQLIDMLDDPHGVVSLIAAWMVVPMTPKASLSVIRRFIFSEDQELRCCAAFILGRMGSIGEQLASQVLAVTPDFFVKANLALGAVGCHGIRYCSADILYSFLILNKTKMMWCKVSPNIRLLLPSKVSHSPHTSEYPHLVNALTRLEVLEKLLILKHSSAENIIQEFLIENKFGIAYTALQVLFQEGNLMIFDKARELLINDDEKIRLQAAFILAYFDQNMEALDVLESMYFEVDRDIQLKILEILGHIGSNHSMVFLINQLDNPHHVLKIVAASSLIQCMRH